MVCVKVYVKVYLKTDPKMADSNQEEHGYCQPFLDLACS